MAALTATTVATTAREVHRSYRSFIAAIGYGSLALLLTCCGSGGGSESASAPSTVSDGPRIRLEVRMRAGITATPAQDADYPVGTSVHYQFVANDPMASVEVTMDGNSVAASGTVVMNAYHRFEAAVRNHPGYYAPDFRGQTPAGQMLRLSDYRGRYVIVDFSEVTCPGSVNQAAYLQSHFAALQSKGMDIVTVMVHGTTIGTTGSQFDASATLADALSWKNTYGLSFPVVIDADNSTLIYNWDNQAQSTDFPSTYIIDPNGMILYKFRGFVGADIDAALRVVFP
jgi:cytochrome c biogenesis protein CcmG/thiol:disulfide interchange protein DsbE